VAIVYDAVSTGTAKALTVSCTHTCAGSDRAVVAVVAGIRNSATDWDFDSVTYDSVAMTRQLTTGANATPARDMRVEIWTLLNPNTTGGATCEATVAGVALLSASIAVVSFANVSAIGASNSALGVGTAATVSVTTTVANSWLAGGVGAFDQASATGTPGVGVTERWDFEAAGDYAADDHNNMGGHRATTTVGAYAFAYTTPTSDDWFALAVELTPIPSGGGTDVVGADLLIGNYGVQIYG